jgi:hypothetical protein
VDAGDPTLNLDITGLEGAAEQGTPTVALDAAPVGQEGAAEVEVPALAGAVAIDGLEGTGELGGPTPTLDSEAVGLEGTSEYAPPTLTADIEVVGVEATGELGTISFTQPLDLFPDGVEGTAEVDGPTFEYTGAGGGDPGGGGGTVSQPRVVVSPAGAGYSRAEVERLLAAERTLVEQRVRAEMAASRTTTAPSATPAVITAPVITGRDMPDLTYRAAPPSVTVPPDTTGAITFTPTVSRETPVTVTPPPYPDLSDEVARLQQENEALAVLLMAVVE